MQEKCVKCGEIIDDVDLKTICFKCRKRFSDEFEKLISLERFEEARNLISSLILSGHRNERWKQRMLGDVQQKHEDSVWRKEEEIRLKKEEETRERERLIKLAMEKQEQEKKRQGAETKHRESLVSSGISYLGVSIVTEKRTHRITHCYNCMAGLDNAIDVECNACGWIICACGACGCLYDERKAVV